MATVAAAKRPCISCEAQTKKAADWLNKHIIGLSPAAPVVSSAPVVIPRRPTLRTKSDRPPSHSARLAALKVPDTDELARLLTRSAAAVLNGPNKAQLLARLRNHRSESPTAFRDLGEALAKAETAATLCYARAHADTPGSDRCRRLSYVCGKLNEAVARGDAPKTARRAAQAAEALVALRVEDVLGATFPASSGGAPHPPTERVAERRGLISQRLLLRCLRIWRRAVLNRADTKATGLTGTEFRRLLSRLHRLAYVHGALRHHSVARGRDDDAAAVAAADLHARWYARLSEVMRQMTVVLERAVGGTRDLCELGADVLHMLRNYAKVPFASR